MHVEILLRKNNFGEKECPANFALFVYAMTHYVETVKLDLTLPNH